MNHAPPSYKFVEHNGQLMRENVRTGKRYPCGKQVSWQGRTTRASIVLHWVRTGEHVARVPRSNLNFHRALVRVNGKLIHLGYFATVEDKMAAIFLHRIGLTPTK